MRCCVVTATSLVVMRRHGSVRVVESCLATLCMVGTMFEDHGLTTVTYLTVVVSVQ